MQSKIGLKKVSIDIIRFFLIAVEDYRKNQNFFEERQLEFYGLQLEFKRLRKVLIKGIPKDLKIDDILNLNY